MRHLVAGAITGPDVERRAEAFLRLLDAGSSKRTLLWRVRAGRELSAVVLTILGRGHVGFLYHSPADVPGVDDRALIPLLRAISRETLRRGAVMVQSILESPHDADDRILTAAGLEPLAELISMQCELSNADETESGEWRFLNYRRFRRATLIETIRRTYEDTLDCPRLTGVRRPEDVLASHRSTGLYRPDWWRLALRGDEPAGCILVNAATTPSTAVIVYMGAVKKFRGRGLGNAMLHHAQHDLRIEGVRRLTLSVDADNFRAKRLYDRFGFVETGRKCCFVLLAARKRTGCE